MITKFYRRPDPLNTDQDTDHTFVKGLYDDDHAEPTDQMLKLYTWAQERETLVLIGGRTSLKAMLKRKLSFAVISPFRLGVLFSRAKTPLGENYSVIQVVAYKPDSNFGSKLQGREDFIPQEDPAPTLSNVSLEKVLGKRLEK